MKRMISLAIALLVLLSTAALADNMIVVNCNEWVSLREGPSTSAKRLKKVPLYETVEDCEWVDGGFVRCTWQGVTGYIQDKYLEPLEPDEAETVLDAALQKGGVEVLAMRQYNGGEKLTVIASDASGNEAWRLTTQTMDVTELTQTDAFIGGTADDPRVMVYNAESGLRSLNASTGEQVWMLNSDEVRLGASITHAVDKDGTMYICGYYGPDPVCIDADGKVLWRSASGSDDIYWPYEIAIEDRGIVTRYDMMDSEAQGGGFVIYDKADGHVAGIEYDAAQ